MPLTSEQSRFYASQFIGFMMVDPDFNKRMGPGNCQTGPEAYHQKLAANLSQKLKLSTTLSPEDGSEICAAASAGVAAFRAQVDEYSVGRADEICTPVMDGVHGGRACGILEYQYIGLMLTNDEARETVNVPGGHHRDDPQYFERLAKVLTKYLRLTPPIDAPAAERIARTAVAHLKNVRQRIERVGHLQIEGIDQISEPYFDGLCAESR
jgi:hypothetical protein